MANGNKIPKDKAIKWVKKYKDKHTNSTNSIQYDASIVQELLNIPGCVQVRVHFAENDDGTNVLVWVAVDAGGNAILPPDGTSTAVDSAFILDDGNPCPPTCPGGDL